MKVRAMLKLLKAHGWYIDRTKGSHRQLCHPKQPGVVTVVGKPSDDLGDGMVKSILHQAGLKDGKDKQ
jgi:predicted RNA binding protein YcfA (HicA-like mRNA interferase family)